MELIRYSSFVIRCYSERRKRDFNVAIVNSYCCYSQHLVVVPTRSSSKGGKEEDS